MYFKNVHHNVKFISFFIKPIHMWIRFYYSACKDNVDINETVASIVTLKSYHYSQIQP